VINYPRIGLRLDRIRSLAPTEGQSRNVTDILSRRPSGGTELFRKYGGPTKAMFYRPHKMHGPLT